MAGWGGINGGRHRVTQIWTRPGITLDTPFPLADSLVYTFSYFLFFFCQMIFDPQIQSFVSCFPFLNFLFRCFFIYLCFQFLLVKGKPFASKIYISLFASISLLVHRPDSIDESKCWHWLHIDLDSRKGHLTKSCTKRDT